MIFSISKKIPQFVICDGRKFKITPYFNRVLNYFDIYENLLDEEKIIVGIDFFCPQAKRKTLSKQAEILSRIFELLLGKKTDGKKLFDFKQDAAFIYAAFLQIYNIDLLKQHNKMDWRIFYALFLGLPKSTKLADVIDIRAQPIPKTTKHNSKQVAALIRAKKAVELKLTAREREEQIQNGLRDIAVLFKNMKKRK